jgi:hypothetical protein
MIGDSVAMMISTDEGHSRIHGEICGYVASRGRDRDGPLNFLVLCSAFVPCTFKSILIPKSSRSHPLEQLDSIVVDALDVIRTGDFPRGANVHVPAVHAVVGAKLEACAAI